MRLSTMSEWLSWIGSVHNKEIELGLDRIKIVAARLNLLSPACRVIIVGGTNGKGSTVAALEAIYRAAGYRTGAFTSPVMFTHNEQVRVDGKLASDEEFCQAFNEVEASREDVSLTPFEYHTLAALLIFQKYSLDILILEVGLGGRLDAVNILDADVAVVTSIDIDHVEWLGETREKIGFEKSGIYRKNKPAVCGDFDPPQSLIDYANKIDAPLFCQGKEFVYHQTQNDKWNWTFNNTELKNLPINPLTLQNMSTALMVITLLQKELPVTREIISKGLTEVNLTGRIQIITGDVTEIYDVSHNPAAVLLLANKLRTLLCVGKTYGVFSMLEDKDIVASIKTIHDEIDHWYVAPIQNKRAASIDKLRNVFLECHLSNVSFTNTVKSAYEEAKLQANQGDRIIIFGSFHTVAEAMTSSQRLY